MRALTLLPIALLVAGCSGEPSGEPDDGGVADSGVADPDSGTTDAGHLDAGEGDAGDPDAGSQDAGDPDAGEPDAGSPDAGEEDAGVDLCANVTCVALDGCHEVGVCDPLTGACSNPVKSDGTACNDQNACTQLDACQDGACVGQDPVSCAAMSACHEVGVCDPATGACSNPAKTDGEACDDANACTQTDACLNGVCVGSAPVTCAATACRNAGACDPLTGACTGAAINEGGSCNDADPCTAEDRCVLGSCRSPLLVCVEGGDTHNCSIRSNGTLWCAGGNKHGQLGLGTTSLYANPTPAQVGTASDWIGISSGTNHTCGIRSPGTLWCWGRNVLGEVGDGTKTQRTSPVQIGTATNWRMVSAGYAHTCGLRGTGSLYCWGYNISGQLGDGTTTDRLTPKLIGTATWRYVGTGNGHTCGLRTDGTIWCAGWNGSGQLGDNTQTQRNTAVQAGTKSDWTALSVGFYYNCAIDAAGTRWCWGSNGQGSFGNTGNGSSYWTPLQADSATNWFSIGSGIYTTCGTRTDGSLWCWGGNDQGQVGKGAAGMPELNPVQVGTQLDWRSVTTSQSGVSGYGHVCGRREGGGRYCWGYNGYGTLGDGTTTDRHAPVSVP